jgi:hypothetical protein
MAEWLLSRRDKLIVTRHEYVFSACCLRRRPERVPEGQMIVARRFIAGFRDPVGLRPGGTPEFGAWATEVV